MQRPYTDSDLYDMFANQADPADTAAMDVDVLAGQLAELIGNDDPDGYPVDTDGTINLYAVGEAIQRQARRLVFED